LIEFEKFVGTIDNGFIQQFGSDLTIPFLVAYFAHSCPCNMYLLIPFIRFRLNFSHGEHDQKQELLSIIRQVEGKYEHPIAILGDLQGPKLRVGKFARPDGEMVQTGQAFRFDLDETLGTAQRVMLPHPEIIEASARGHVLLVDDGKVKLEVTGTGPGYIDCVVGTV
jgi:pyruvate kinase